MFKAQLELTLAGTPARSPLRRHYRTARARWWFNHMRQVVDSATDYHPAPEPLPLPATPAERQICE